jgi:ABC-2 type transport system permease protein
VGTPALTPIPDPGQVRGGQAASAAGARRPEPGAPWLLRPRVLSLRNGFVTADAKTRTVYILFAIAGVLFWGALLWFLWFVVRGFYAVEVFGPLLTRKLLEVLLVSLFVMLVFSNAITALSTFFLSGDLELLLSLPVRRSRFHYARLAESLVQSSMMMILFGFPAFLAYGMVYHAGPAYYAVLLVVIPAFVLIPGSLGALAAAVLVNVFPARRTRELMALAGLLVVVALFVLVRLVRPERFMDAQAFDSLAAYVAEVQAPMPRLFPPRWASDVLTATLQQRPMPWESLGLLVLGALAVTGVVRWVVTRLYTGGWARAQEAQKPRGARSSWLRLLVDLAERAVPRIWRPIVAKDVRTFFRDPAQWSQVFLLASLVGIYLFSVHSIPMEQFHGVWAFTIRRSLAFLNLGMAAFVMAGVAIRFQFSAVSTEGRAFWVARASPVRPLEFLWAKSVPGLLPTLVVGEALTVASSLILGAGTFITAVGAGTALVLAFAMSGIGIALGAVYPNFKADNAARVATGPSGVLFMVLALVLSAVVLLLEAGPVWLWLRAEAQGRPLGGWEVAGVVGGLLAVTALCTWAAVDPMRRAAPRLWRREV